MPSRTHKSEPAPHPEELALLQACCRTAWDLLLDPRSRRGVEVAERALQGQASGEEMRDAAREAEAAWKAARSLAQPRIGTLIWAAEAVALLTDWARPAEEVASGTACMTGPAHPGWLVLDPARLLVLADALEDAGCDDAGLLGHLRGPGPHVRGCVALDVLLERS